MRGKHRYLETAKGVTSFAYVEVDATLSGEQSDTIVEDLAKSPDAAEGEVNRFTAAPWIDAAVEGIKDGRRTAQGRDSSVQGIQLALIKVVGTTVDTTETAVRRAAEAATLNAIQATAQVAMVNHVQGSAT